MAPSDLIEILILDVALNDALTELCFATREVPLGQADCLASCRVMILVDHLSWHLDVKQWIKGFNRQESSIARVTLDLSAEAFFKSFLKLAGLVGLLTELLHQLPSDEL